MTELNDTTVLDYSEFKITIKNLIGTKKFANQAQLIQAKYARKDAMIEKGLLSKEQEEQVTRDKEKDIAGLYADMVILAWEGVWKNRKGEVVYDFNKNKCERDNIVKFVMNKDHQDLVADIVEQATMEANFIKEQEEAEIKNSEKS